MESIITNCVIEKVNWRNEIWVTYNTGEQERIGHYYPDELCYSTRSFIGLTRDQALRFMIERDTAYLRR